MGYSIFNIKKLTGLLYLIPLLAVIPVIFTFLEKPLSVFPSEKKYILGPIDDSFEKGTSVVHTLTRENVIRFEYTLGKKGGFPYAGLYFRFSPGPVGLDISKYEYIKLKIKSTNSNSIRLNLKFYMDEYTIVDDSSSFYPMEYELFTDPSRVEYKIPLKHFSSLAWWFMQTGFPETEKVPGLFKNLYNFQIHSGDIPPGVKDTIIIESISFHRSNASFYIITTAVILIYYIALFVVLYFIKQPVTPGVIGTMPSHHTGDAELQKILGIIKENYTDPVFSIWKVNEETGLYNRKISNIVKKKFSKSFIQLVNEMRISNAKKLLKETDLSATDIAYQVGYNSYTHFTREFKKHTSQSPQKYRLRSS